MKKFCVLVLACVFSFAAMAQPDADYDRLSRSPFIILPWSPPPPPRPCDAYDYDCGFWKHRLEYQKDQETNFAMAIAASGPAAPVVGAVLAIGYIGHSLWNAHKDRRERNKQETSKRQAREQVDNERRARESVAQWKANVEKYNAEREVFNADREKEWADYSVFWIAAAKQKNKENAEKNVNQMDQDVKKDKAPKDIKHVHKGEEGAGEVAHVHFADGTSINIDGSIHKKSKGIPNPSKKAKKWLASWGWPTEVFSK